MPATSTDRLNGLTTSVAVKAPVRSVSTANLTLAGEQSVNGVALVSGDRVLVKDQSIPPENGIYVVSTGSWVRSKDFDGNRDAVKGTLVVSNDGAGSIYYRVTTPNPITIGTTAINFEVVSGVLTQSIIGGLLYPLSEAEGLAGLTNASIASHYIPYGYLERYGAVADDATDNAIPIANAIAQARQMGGAPVRPWAAGIYRTTEPVVLYEGVSMWGIASQGVAGMFSGIRYVGGEFVDVVTTASVSEDDSISFKHWRVLGGQFRQGTARYGFYAEQFHRGCEVVGCIFRDCYGPIKIVSGYYAQVHHNIFGLVTPTQTAGGASDAEFAQVYGGSTAPIHLGEMNGCDCSHNIFSQLVSQHGTASQPAQAIYVSGQDVNCRSWIIESTGVDYATFSPRMDFMIRNDGYADFSGLYVEAVDVQQHLIVGLREAITNIVGFSMLNCAGNTIFRNQAIGDMTIDKGVAYDVDFVTAWAVSSANLGVGGEINIGPDVRIVSGNRLTDAAVNSDADNVYDTFGTSNPYGAVDGSVVRFHHQRTCFPRVVAGLVVTGGGDANGQYVQITSGVLLSERGSYVNAKWRTGNTASGNMAVRRLRPNVSSRYYRIYVGRAGNLYLVESETAFTDATGDWLSSFSTTAGGVIQNLAANPRLTLRGTYCPGTSTATVYNASASPGSGIWNRGDQWINTTPSAGGSPGSVCTASGTPGTWNAMANVAA